jgi:hypothetical protein
MGDLTIPRQSLFYCSRAEDHVPVNNLLVDLPVRRPDQHPRAPDAVNNCRGTRSGRRLRAEVHVGGGDHRFFA